MQLTVREVAELLHIEEKTVYAWIADVNLPHRLIDGQYRFNRSEILEWAHARRISVSTAVYRREAGRSITAVAEAIEAGGVIHGLAGHDKASVLRALVNALKLPEGTDRDALYEIVVAREKMGSSGVGRGLAIPHVRNPIVLPVRRPVMTICFLEHPIEFVSPDNVPVHTLFWLVTPSVRSHTHMLARLAGLLQDSGFQSVLARRGTREEILNEARRIEAGSTPPSSGNAP